MGFSQVNGWTVPTPSGDVSGTTTSDTKIIYVAANGHDTNYNGRSPFPWNFTGASYDHTGNPSGERCLSATGAFTGFTVATDVYANKIFITAATGGMTANRLYEIVTKVDNDTVLLAANSALTADATGVAAAASGPRLSTTSGYGLLRSGSPDWLLFRTGDTWTNETITAWNKDGKNEQERMLVSCYGDGARPIFKVPATTSFFTFSRSAGDSMHDLAIIGLDVYGYNQDPADPTYPTASTTDNTAFFGLQGGVSSNWLIENCRIRYMRTGVDFGGDQNQWTNVVVRRNVLENIYRDGGHSQGIHWGGMGSVLVEENILYGIGYLEATGRGTAPGVATVFNHGIYMSEYNPFWSTPNTVRPDNSGSYIIRNNIIANISSHGIQARPGATIQGNLIMYAAFGALLGGEGSSGTGRTAQPNGIVGKIQDNVILYGCDINASNTRGAAFDIVGINGGSCLIDNNIMAFGNGNGAQKVPLSLKGFAVNWGGSAWLTNNLTITRNVIYQWDYDGAWCRGDGGVTSPARYVEVPGDDSGVTIVSQSNNYWWDRASAGAGSWADFPVDASDKDAENTTFVDATRTPAAYSTLKGGGGTYDAFMTSCRAQQKSAWDANYTAQAFNAYMRAGFTEQGQTPSGPALTRNRIRYRVRVQLT